MISFLLNLIIMCSQDNYLMRSNGNFEDQCAINNAITIKSIWFSKSSSISLHALKPYSPNLLPYTKWNKTPLYWVNLQRAICIRMDTCQNLISWQTFYFSSNCTEHKCRVPAIYFEFTNFHTKKIYIIFHSFSEVETI